MKEKYHVIYSKSHLIYTLKRANGLINGLPLTFFANSEELEPKKKQIFEEVAQKVYYWPHLRDYIKSNIVKQEELNY